MLLQKSYKSNVENRGPMVQPEKNKEKSFLVVPSQNKITSDSEREAATFPFL